MRIGRKYSQTDQTCRCLLFSVFCPECKQTPMGREYTGTLNTTESGTTCQAWASITYQHPAMLDDSNYPDGSRAAAMNYCRNPDSDAGGPWCYTNVSWGTCDVPLCSGRCITLIKCKKNEVYKNGYRRRCCTSKTAKIRHFVRLVMYCIITTLPVAFY